MKTIHEIKKEEQDKLNTLFTQCLVFWAFSNEQFEQNKTPLQDGEKYVSIGAGGFLPKSKVKELTDGMKRIKAEYKAAIKSNKARKLNIAYELSNHEAYYTCDISDTLSAVGPDYTRDEVQAVYNANREREQAQY